MEKSHSLKRTLCLFGILVQTILLNAQTAVFNKSMNSALAGDPLSQLAVGEWYCQGAQGVSVDFEKGYTWITKALENGPVESTEIKRLMAEYRIGDKTMNDAKVALGIKPFRKMRKWYWVMPNENDLED